MNKRNTTFKYISKLPTVAQYWENSIKKAEADGSLADHPEDYSEFAFRRYLDDEEGVIRARAFLISSLLNCSTDNPSDGTYIIRLPSTRHTVSRAKVGHYLNTWFFLGTIETPRKEYNHYGVYNWLTFPYPEESRQYTIQLPDYHSPGSFIEVGKFGTKAGAIAHLGKHWEETQNGVINLITKIDSGDIDEETGEYKEIFLLDIPKPEGGFYDGETYHAWEDAIAVAKTFGADDEGNINLICKHPDLDQKRKEIACVILEDTSVESDLFDLSGDGHELRHLRDEYYLSGNKYVAQVAFKDMKDETHYCEFIVGFEDPIDPLMPTHTSLLWHSENVYLTTTTRFNLAQYKIEGLTRYN